MRGIAAALFTLCVLACAKGNGAGGSSGTPFVDMYRIGRSLAPDGSATDETNVYVVGEPVYMSFIVRNAPSDAKIRLVFSTLPENRKVAELEQNASKKGFVSFKMNETKSWELGTYRAEYFLLEGGAWKSLGIHDFKLVASRTGAQ